MARTKASGGFNAALRQSQREETKAAKGAESNDQVPNGKKRKLEDDDTEQPSKKVETDTSNRPEQTEFDASVATISPEELVTRYRDAIKRTKGDLSTIELEDLSIPATAVQDTTEFEEPRLVKNLAAFLEKVTPGGKEELCTSKKKSSPHTLLLTSSAIRATDLIRAVRVFGSEENKIAKLFAKHMKLKEGIKYVKKSNFGIGAGTPKRVQELIEADALQLDQLQRIVVDASYVDDKKNTIFDQHDVFPQVLSLFTSEKLNLRLHSNATKIIVF